jgi:hypothetical protein
MEESSLSFDESDEIFWNKYENIQKHFEEIFSYHQVSIKYFKEVLAEIEHHYVKLNAINANAEILFKKDTKYTNIFQLFKKTINFYNDICLKFICNTINNFEAYNSKLKQLTPAYSNFKQFSEMYKSQVKKFNKIKEKFIESVSLAESKTMEKMQKKNEKQFDENNIISKKIKKDVLDNFKKYQSSIEEINKKREEFVSKQKNLIQLDIELELFYINSFYDIINNFLSLNKNKTIEFIIVDRRYLYL